MDPSKVGAEPQVYLVGAGPGDPGLITVKGLEIVKKADVIIYDYLANPRLLSHAKEGAEVVYAGKSGHHRHIDQEEINALLLSKAGPGKIVCRLKGGDAFVFGRGGEEAVALAEAGISFEVVPGVTSAYAVPAYAGIPVTHRGVASDVAFITGHEEKEKNGSFIDWEKLARGVGTLVFLMGVSNLERIARELKAHGRDHSTPVALIRWGTTPRQQTLVGTLGSIVERAAAADFRPPAVIVVGDVVSLRDKINWFETKPLFGRRIVVTRARAQASLLVSALEGLGAEAIECPTIKTVPLDDYSGLDEAIREIASHNRGEGAPIVDIGEDALTAERLRSLPAFDWIVLTSANGVDYFFERLRFHDLDVRALAGSRILAIGPATAERVRATGLHPDLVPEKFVAEDVLSALESEGVGEGTRVLLPRAKVARDLLPRELAALSVEVWDVPAYETLPARDNLAEAVRLLKEGGIDYLTFTSSSTARNFFTEVLAAEGIAGADGETRGYLGQLLGEAKIVSIGPITSKTIRSFGLDVALEPVESTIEDLVAAISSDAAGSGN